MLASRAPRGQKIFDTYLLAVAGFGASLATSSLGDGAGARRGVFALGTLILAPIALAAGALAELAGRAAARPARVAFAVVAGIDAGAVTFLATRSAEGAPSAFASALALAAGGVVGWGAGPHLASAHKSGAPAFRLAALGLGLATTVACFVWARRASGAGGPGALGVMAVVGLAIATLAYGPSERGGSIARRDPHVRRALELFGAVRALAALVSIFAGATMLPPPAERAALTARIDAEGAPFARAVVGIAVWLDPIPPPPNPAEGAPKEPKAPLDLEGWDVLVVTLEGVRADHVRAYGYDRPTTPTLDGLAREGVRFDAAYTAAPETPYAVSSLLAGTFTRPLVAMGLADGIETIATVLGRAGYATAAFFPPTVLPPDDERIAPLRSSKLGFSDVALDETADEARPASLERWLGARSASERVLAWVHLDGPRAPYEGQTFGARDVDRYDAEIAAADRVLGALVETMRAHRPRSLVIVAADHGEEFGEHGGRYHGSTVYEEQVRVPLVLSAPGALAPRVVLQTVSLVDVLPTALRALSVAPPPHLLGRPLVDVLAGQGQDGPGLGTAYAESRDMTLFGRGRRRLVCLRRAGGCALYDLDDDPRERRDIAPAHAAEVVDLRAELASIEARHGRDERASKPGVDRALPEALRRALTGDESAAPEVAKLLTETDVEIRRGAARVLFELKNEASAPLIRAAITREQDETVKAFEALALVRMGQGAPYVFELLTGRDRALRRLAALALAEAGDRRGEAELLQWWLAAFPSEGKAAPEDVLEVERAKQVAAALAALKSKLAVGALLRGLSEPRIRPEVAKALAALGEDGARPALAERLMTEPYVTTRVVITEALLKLGAGPDLRDPLVSMLGLPDPLPNGVLYAKRAKMLKHVGGPAREAELGRLRRFATSGVLVDFVVPELTKGALGPPPGSPRVRVICRATAPAGGEIRIGPRGDLPTSSEKKSVIPENRPALDPSRTVTLRIPRGEGAAEVFAELPAKVKAAPGKQASLVFFATQGVEVEACVLVPLRQDLHPPP